MAGQEHLWSIILAGGEGERTSRFIKHWLGAHKPKQYCRFVGTRSLFQHTVDRADLLTSAEQRAIVIAQSHQTEAQAQLIGRGSGHLIPQPQNCGTAAGVFLPITCVYARDPEATVVIFPSDHFVFPEEGFNRRVRDAVAAVEKMPRKVILLGAFPSSPEQDYGWILPGNDYRRFPFSGLRTVKRFLEKPGPAGSQSARDAGGLWNTLIVVARAAMLWKLGRCLLPDMMLHFSRVAQGVGGPYEQQIIENAYQTMPVYDFSVHILQRAARQLAVMNLDGIYWSDWGRPERIQKTLATIGKQPLFPVEALLAS